MEAMNTHESYVSLETAKMLKEAGFNWKCSSLYTSNGKFKHLLYDTIDWDYKEVDWNNITCKKTSDMGIKGWEGGYSAPTLTVAQKWLRESYGYHVGTLFIDSYDCNFVFEKFVYIPLIGFNTIIETGSGKYDTYEEALEAAIKKCLTVILEKK